MQFLKGVVFLVMVGMGIIQEVTAQTPVVLSQIEGEVVLDGFSDEAAWDGIAPLSMTTYSPTFQAEPTERTEIRVGYDDTYLYVAGRLYDSDPSGIRTNSLDRDRYDGDDVFSIALDTFDDNENALWFFTNPAGVRFDTAVSNDAEFGDGPALNTDWNTFWDVQTARNDSGWFVEMRIPFSSLGFQSTGDRVVVGLSAFRYITRKNERHVYPAIQPNWNYGFVKPSQMQQVELNDVGATKPVYVTPYALTGFEQMAALNNEGTAYDLPGNTTAEAGFDLKYNFSSATTLDLTVNTDFAQVEADYQQINLTRFSIFFPEKRQFFQERANLFNFSTGGPDRLFYSRRIGLANGVPVPIIGGARMVSRVGMWDMGLLNMQTASFKGQSSENFGVARVQRRVVNPYSTAGAMVVSRIAADGHYNVAYGLDGDFRLSNRQYLSVKWAQTFDDEAANPFSSFATLAETGLARVQWERQGQVGFNYTFSATRAGALYNPDTGFLSRRDFTLLYGRLGYGWLTDSSSSLFMVRPNFINANIFLRNEDGSIESASVGHFWNFHFRNGAFMWFNGNMAWEDVREPFVLAGEVEIQPGRYVMPGGAISFTTSDARLIRLGLNARTGRFYDGWIASLGLQPSWTVSRFLTLGIDYDFNRLHFSEQATIEYTHLVRLRVQGAVDKRLSASALLQYANVHDSFLASARLRYNMGEGRDLWIVYNESMNTDRNRFNPALPLTDARALLVKYTHTFHL